jgi:outer membrane immunogenic protein
MKKQLLVGAALLAAIPSAAMAADLSRPAPAPAPVYTKAPPPMFYNWSGCYVGANGGGGWAHKVSTTTAAFGAFPGGSTQGTLDISGGVIGAQVGCNYQFSPSWVVGVQGDWDWSGASGSFTDAVFAGITDTIKVKSVGSVTGRLGYAWDRALLYVKGGGAWETDDYSATGAAVALALTGDTRSGWTVGGGLEYGFTDWLTGFAEYDYYDFGTRGETLVGTAAPATISVKETKSVAKVGLNFKFGWGGPVMSRY